MIGGVVLVLLFGYFLMKGQSSPAVETPREVMPTSETVQNPSPTVAVMVPTGATESSKVMEKTSEVNYLDSGFSPKSITVKLGTTVTWTNKSGKLMWVASAVHPTHQEYPGFDQLKSVGKGETYAFTFTKKGSWKYHNHTSASDTGTVVVD